MKRPALSRPSLHRRERVRTRELEEMFYFLEDMREYLAVELDARKKEKEELEKKAKGTESFFVKKFSFTTLLFANLVTGPLLGLILFTLIWTRFH